MTDDDLILFRLAALEDQARALGAAVGQVARLDAELDAAQQSDEKLETTHRLFRIEVRQEFSKLRDELREDRRESRNRTLLALSPIALASLGIFVKVVLGIDLPGGSG